MHQEHSGHEVEGIYTYAWLLGRRVWVVNRKYPTVPRFESGKVNVECFRAVWHIIDKESDPYGFPVPPLTFEVAIDIGDLRHTPGSMLILILDTVKIITESLGINERKVAIAECGCVIVGGEIRDLT